LESIAVIIKKFKPVRMENKNMNQAEAVIYFLQRLDIEMLSLILENHQYQYFEKEVFIKKLGEALQKFTAAGDSF